MARQSVEALSAASWRAGGTLAAPPTYLSRDARRVWRDIVTSKPVDYFGVGGLILLETFVVAAVASRAAFQRLAASEPGSREYKQALTAVVKLGGLMCSIGTKLRLLPSSVYRANDGRLTESGLGRAGGDSLLGGAAAWPPRKPN